MLHLCQLLTVSPQCLSEGGRGGTKHQFESSTMTYMDIKVDRVVAKEGFVEL